MKPDPESQAISRVLIVEDDEAQLRSLSMILRSEGFDVVTCSTGAEALEYLANDDIDVAIVDLRLPDVDETELLARLSDHSERVPMIINTGYGSYASARHAIDGGAFAFVEKGADPAELVGHVHRAIQTRLRRRTEELEAAVAERTRELDQSNEALRRDIIERKRAEVALVHERDLLQALLENIPDFIYFKDIDARFFRVSDAFDGLLGCTADEIIGKTDLEIFPAEFANESLREDQHVIRTGTPIVNKVEACRLSADVTKWVLTTKIPWVNRKGKTLGLLGISRDITELKRVEEAAREAQDRAQLYLDIASVMFVALDSRGVVTLANKQACDILGYREGELIGRDWFSTCLPERESAEVYGVFQSLLAGEIASSSYFENHVLTSDGEERLIAWHNSVVRGPEGGIIGTLASGEDITERKRVALALTESEERYRPVVDNISLGTVLLSTDYKIKMVNSAIGRMFDKPVEYFVNRNCFEVFHKREAACSHCAGIQAMATGLPQEVETEGVRDDGTRFPVLNRVFPVRDANGNTTSFIEIVEVLTEKREAARRLRQREAELAHVSRVHTIGVMAATLAHELNQPLYAINNYVRGIQRRLKNANAVPGVDHLVGAIEQVVKEVDRAAGIVTHLREFVGGRAPRRSSVDMGRLLQQAVDLLSSLARDKRVKLKLEAPGDFPFVEADPIQLEQVVVNLVRNAIDAVGNVPAKRRRITVTIRLSETDDAEIVVRDCGPGVAKDFGDKLFEAFATTKKHGLGVGLAISQSIVESHGGKIWMVDNEPHGAAFHFTIPISLARKESNHGH